MNVVAALRDVYKAVRAASWAAVAHTDCGAIGIAYCKERRSSKLLSMSDRWKIQKKGQTKTNPGLNKLA